ncbi:type II toxin-antitoxin system VapC family toxin [Oscillatoria sp. CS-180]|uniref:type II toxin-antitoxin system VapC family toxin n=1 Tax=Oscillatoria sp. CS-180 TaxID=3021720 RepID=UPI0023303D86|nr:type II toxin-antitoxin system VapC family toxin [Oscillatoria sp. CS-180]MDB9524574.1 type II toxin-antitoxin system VapC family toxin [Oscillatoria sp. CS-180]
MAVDSNTCFVLDTNIVLYLLGGRLAGPLPAGTYAVSVITEMELLSYPSLTAKSENQIRSLLTHLQIVELNVEVKKAAIRLRQQHGLKLPDAIVAATTSTLEAILLTNDVRLLKLNHLLTRSLRLKTL